MVCLVNNYKKLDIKDLQMLVQKIELHKFVQITRGLSNFLQSGNLRKNYFPFPRRFQL